MKEAMKQIIAEIDALPEGLEGYFSDAFDDNLAKVREALAQPEQEPVAWTADDMAYRPSGLPQDFIRHEVESVYDWSDWVCPSPEQYFMKCCDCGLVHEMQFKVAKYKLGNECEFVEDTNLQAVFKVRRTHPAQRTEQEHDPLPRACNLAGVDYQTFLKIKAYMPAYDTTTPPQRTWVGLTDEEENALIPDPDGSAEANVRRVEVLPGLWGKEYEEVDAWSKPLVLQMLHNHEAKLKEKNT